MANKSITSCGPYLTFGYDEYLVCVFSGFKPNVNHSLNIFETQEKNEKPVFPTLFSAQMEGTEFH